MRHFAIGTVLAVVCVLAGDGFAATYYIKADGSGDAATIQAGADAATAGDTLLLAAGVFTGVGNYDIDFAGKDLVLVSESGANDTVIDCQGNGQGFIFTNDETSAAVIEGVTITNGYTAGNGGAILCNSASPTIRNNVMIANHADGSGGALRLQWCNSIVENNTLVENSAAALAGGISVGVFSAPQISYNIIAFSTLGAATACNGSGANPTYACNDLFGNIGGDVICGTDGGNNATSDPEFCGVVGSGDVYLQVDSPCQPLLSPCGVLIGALGVNCATVSTEAGSWGQLKALYQ